MKCFRCDKKFSGYEMDHALYRMITIFVDIAAPEKGYTEHLICYRCVTEILKEYCIKKLEVDELKKS